MLSVGGPVFPVPSVDLVQQKGPRVFPGGGDSFPARRGICIGLCYDDHFVSMSVHTCHNLHKVVSVCRCYTYAMMMYTLAGVAYTSGVYALRRGTDGHLNPAVTVALTVLQRLTVVRCASFVCAQFLGGCS